MSEFSVLSDHGITMHNRQWRFSMMIRVVVILVAEKNGACKLTRSRGPSPLPRWMISQNEPGPCWEQHPGPASLGHRRQRLLRAAYRGRILLRKRLWKVAVLIFRPSGIFCSRHSPKRCRPSPGSIHCQDGLDKSDRSIL